MANMWLETYRAEGQHLPLTEIKEELEAVPNRTAIQQKALEYLSKENIPTYPRPELHVSHVSHSTDLQGLQGIKEDGGFRNPKDSQELKVVWFSLTVSPDELQDAETWDMKLVHPGEQEEEFQGGLPEERTLQKFATSPAFSSRSRYGSFRFTFSLKDVLDEYSKKFCGGQRPVLRVYRTDVYKQEVMYAVLVHSPVNWRRFSEYPLLKDTPHCICSFVEEPKPHFVWRPQAMSKTHRFGLEEDDDNWNLYAQELNRPYYYVWDHVALALHVGDKVLSFEDDELRDSLRFCQEDDVTLPNKSYQGFKKSQAEVRKLWFYHRYQRLQKFHKSDFHINN